MTRLCHLWRKIWEEPEDRRTEKQLVPETNEAVAYLKGDSDRYTETMDEIATDFLSYLIYGNLRKLRNGTPLIF